MEELKDVLRETLENRGALGNVRAHLRAEVSNALEDRTGLKRPDISNENLIINELIHRGSSSGHRVLRPLPLDVSRTDSV